MRAQEITCRTECGIVNIQESTAEQLNCQKRCISEVCYEEVYASDPVRWTDCAL